MNVCSYHLQEAGRPQSRELSYALATAIAVLDRVRQSGEVDGQALRRSSGGCHFSSTAKRRFVTELAKMRAFVDVDEITRDRFGACRIASSARFRPASRSIRSASPSSSLKTTPIASSLRCSRSCCRRRRARAVQLPAWNEALGLPRPFDQQWSLRLQQIMAYETDLLEFGDIFDGSKEIEALSR